MDKHATSRALAGYPGNYYCQASDFERQTFYAKYSGNDSKKKPNPEVCVVWDTNQSAWCSFRWDRMKRVQFAIG